MWSFRLVAAGPARKTGLILSRSSAPAGASAVLRNIAFSCAPYPAVPTSEPAPGGGAARGSARWSDQNSLQ
jgi:hypothetical protein